jgi:flagellar biosynthetic protein FlhB
MADEFGEKTEAPTPKRKQKAVEQGQLLKSRDFAAAIIVLIGCFWMVFFGPSLIAACKAVMTTSFQFGRAEVEHFEPWRPLAEAGWRLAPSMGGLLVVAVLAAVVSQAGLGALMWNNKLFAPKASRINPASGLKRMFGPTGWIEMGKGIAKVILLGAIGWWMLASIASPSIGLLSSGDINAAVGLMGDKLITLLFAMAGGLLLIAGIDVPIQLIRHLKQLRMSKQEIRDEHKETEGSPEAKGMQRQRQREIVKGGFRKQVAAAHVVLTNPTHFSVALRYDSGNDQVPVVVAKGRGQTALAIRELAAEFEVPVLEYPALARAVYYTSREGQEVRDDLYHAIAAVLAFVFGVNHQAGGSQPPVSVPDSALFDENGKKLARAT